MSDTQIPDAGESPQENPVYRGQVVYFYAFDLAYDMKREPLVEILGQPLQEYALWSTRRSPKQLFFYRPQMVHLPNQQCESANGVVQIERIIKIFNVGAISIQFRVPFEAADIDDLTRYHKLSLGNESIEEQVRKLAENVRQELLDYCIRPAGGIGRSEDYTVFCLYELPEANGAPAVPTEQWLHTNRRRVAALLMQEQDPERLSEQEAAESTEQYLTYYDSDLVVVDWEAALVIGEQKSLEDVLHIVELANIQLLELGAYDRILDGSLETAYRDLSRPRARPKRQVHRNLREIRVDMARFNDELLNITKFFGDWHLAKTYQSVAGRFHLADWHRVINEKTKTLGELYQLLQQDWNNFWMVVLEATIVLLFIIDVLLLLLGSR